MKFVDFLLSGYPFTPSVYPDGIQDIPGPPYPSRSRYSILRKMLPGHDGRVIIYRLVKSPAQETGMSDLSVSLPNNPYFLRCAIQHGGEQNPLSKRLLVSEHIERYNFGQPNTRVVYAHLPLIDESDTSLRIRNAQSNNLQHANHDDMLPVCKSKQI